MGLRARIDVLNDWGFPEDTPILHLPIKYFNVGEMFASIAENIAVVYCPVDTGFLQSSIHGNGSDTDGKVEALAEYAQYVEYGTWKMAAQPYFTQAVQYGAMLAFQRASMIYQAKMIEEQHILAAMGEMESEMTKLEAVMLDQFAQATRGDGSNLGGPTHGGYWGGDEQNINGLRFKSDGSLANGRNRMSADPSMWRPGTAMYNVAVERQSHIDEYRAQAMDRFKHDNQLRLTTMGSGLGGRGGAGLPGGSAVHNFGYSVGMYAMSSIIAGGGSFMGGLAGGLLLGGIATIAGLVLNDIFGYDGPEFSMPEIEII